MPTRQIAKDCPLLLGSGSPRRREILRGLGLCIEVRPTDADEDVGLSEPLSFLERVVAEKRAALLRQLGDELQGFAASLVADTIVVLDGDILGKPSDVRDAFSLLSRLAGRTHTVFTRYSLAWDGGAAARTVESRVSLRHADAACLMRYAETGEGLDKAGAYAIQGIGSFLVQSLSGSYSNVVGLPACELVEDLEQAGLLADFPRRRFDTAAKAGNTAG